MKSICLATLLMVSINVKAGDILRVQFEDLLGGQGVTADHFAALGAMTANDDAIKEDVGKSKIKTKVQRSLIQRRANEEQLLGLTLDSQGGDGTGPAVRKSGLATLMAAEMTLAAADDVDALVPGQKNRKVRVISE